MYVVLLSWGARGGIGIGYMVSPLRTGLQLLEFLCQGLELFLDVCHGYLF